VRYSRSRRLALCRLTLAAPGLVADLPGRQARVAVQENGPPLPRGQGGHRLAQRVGPVQVIRRRLPVGGRRRNGKCGGRRLGGVGQQRDRGAAPQAAADVEHDAGQPAREPVRLPQPVQRDERLQERLLHDVVHVAGIGAQARGAGSDHRLVPLHQQPERHRVAVAGQPNQVAVADRRAVSQRRPIPRPEGARAAVPGA